MEIWKSGIKLQNMSTQVAVKLKDLGCYEISLGDTIGVGTPGMYCTLSVVQVDDWQRKKVALELNKIENGLSVCLLGLPAFAF